ncbi:MAG: lipoprotein-releasing ABC transporter permease subunit [Deltaproteobacteria bacterium]|nr:lipoprotein-releasing ABC transporter permease subunit [Candidatus Zymogenaceae bacterium]
MYELLISRRYLRAKRKQSFISLITVISIGGVAIGVAALIIVISVMTGFRDDLQGKILGAHAHLVVKTQKPYFTSYPSVMEKIAMNKNVVALSPFIETQIMLSTEGGISGAVLRGIDPATAPGVIAIEKDLKIGNLNELTDGRDGIPGIVLGKELAKVLRVTYGDPVIMVSPTGGDITPFGMTPRMKRFVVVGIFEAGMFEYDSSFAYVSIPAAQNFLDLPDVVSGIDVKVTDIYRAKTIGDKIAEDLGAPFTTLDWMEMNKNLFAALALEKVAMFVILVMIVFVAAFNIASTLIMLVMEKAKDIAILKAMGSTNAGIMKIFMFEGTIIGAFGTAVGAAFGWGMCILLKYYHFIRLDPNVYYISALPVKIVPSDITVIIISSLVLCALATLYPAWQASRMDPAQAMRYE